VIYEILGSKRGVDQLLRLDTDSVEFKNGELYSGVHYFEYDKIWNLLLSEYGVLSFQVGERILEFPIDTSRPLHVATVTEFVRRLQQRAGGESMPGASGEHSPGSGV
jgi:hypothetical protein